MTVQDAARFGQLYLQGGQWNGEQLIPAQWVEQSTTAKNNGAGDGTGSYGYQWWIRSFQGYDTFYAFGAHGQFIFVVPHLTAMRPVHTFPTIFCPLIQDSVGSSFFPFLPNHLCGKRRCFGVKTALFPSFFAEILSIFS